jgi:hypothetical protein
MSPFELICNPEGMGSSLVII